MKKLYVYEFVQSNQSIGFTLQPVHFVEVANLFSHTKATCLAGVSLRLRESRVSGISSAHKILWYQHHQACSFTLPQIAIWGI